MSDKNTRETACTNHKIELFGEWLKGFAKGEENASPAHAAFVRFCELELKTPIDESNIVYALFAAFNAGVEASIGAEQQ